MKKYILIILFFISNYTIAQIDDFKHIDFTIADNIAKLNKGESLENLPLLSYKLTSKLPTKVEKFRAIYSWVCNNIKGDYSQHKKVAKKRNKFISDSLEYIKWNNEYKKIAFKKLLKYKKTMCTGYAYLIKELAFLSDIECEIIDGYSRTIEYNVEELEVSNHSWNAVKLNDKWYLCDPTWSSGYMDSNNSFKKDYNLGYFLTDPILFAKDHFPIDKKWLLNNEITSTSFLTSPIVYGDTFKQNIFPNIPEKMNVKVKKNEEVNFQLISDENTALDKISLIKYEGSKEIPLKIYDLKSENGVLKFKNKFYWFGFQDVHVKYKENIIASYTFEVSNK